MNAPCDVRLIPGARWHPGTLAAEGERVIARIGDRQYGPRTVHCVRVSSDCPVELLDAAIEAGYWVLGQPRRATS